MKHRNLYYLSALLMMSAFFGYIIFQEQEGFPIPYDTIIIEGEDEDNHLRKQEWIETMHRSAPEDNWRLMDQSFRLNAQSEKQAKTELPVYGKWRELGSNNQSGRTVYTYFDETTSEIYTAADGGQVWKGEIGADNWTSINDHLKIPAIRYITKFHEQDFTRLLIHSAQWNVMGILHSDDDGQNWMAATGLESILNWGFIKRTVVQTNDEKTIYCLSQEWDYNAGHAVSHIYKSSDLGVSFEFVHAFDHNVDYVDIWTSTKNESFVYVMSKDEFYYLDESDNLISIANLPNLEDGNTLLTGFDTGNGIFFYSMIRFNSQSHFYASEMDGQAWLEKGSHSQGPFMVNSFAASSHQQDLLYFGGIEAFTSYNAGQSWNLVNSWGQYYASPEDKLHADIPSFNSFLLESDQELLFINTDGGTYVSYDQMENVENISLSNLRISQYYSSYTCRFDPSYTHAGAQDQGYQRSNQGMMEDVIDYDQIISGDYGSMVSGDGGASIWMTYPGFAMYGPDINNSDYLILENFMGGNYQWLPKLMADPYNPENAYLAGGHITSGAHLIHLERVGGNVNYIEMPFDFSNGTNANISALAYSELNTDYWYVLTTEKDFFYSTDAGVSWTETTGFNGPGSHYFYGASIAPAKNTLGLVYAGGAGYSNPGVFRSDDNGMTFTALDEGLPNTMVFQLALSHDDSLLFAATEVGAFVCKTWEAQWYPLADSIIPDQAFWAVDFVDTLKLARFSTYGRGIWDFELEPDVVADFMANNTHIYVDEIAVFTDLSSFSPISWDWYFEGGIPESSQEQNPEGILYNQSGSFDVRLIVSNNYSTDTILKVDYMNVDIVDETRLENTIQWLIYPNPAHTEIFIQTEEQIDQIQVYSSNGKLCLKINKLELNGNTGKIDISSLPHGVYLVEMLTKEESFVQRIIKQ